MCANDSNDIGKLGINETSEKHAGKVAATGCSDATLRVQNSTREWSTASTFACTRSTTLDFFPHSDAFSSHTAANRVLLATSEDKFNTAPHQYIFIHVQATFSILRDQSR